MRCGARATTTTRRKFSWHPPWVSALILVGLLPYVIVAIVLTKKARVVMPFCDAHKKYWFNHTLLVWGSFGAIVLLGIGLIVLMAILEQAGRGLRGDGLGAYACLAMLGLLLVWLVVIAILGQFTIRPVEITDRSITLTRVSPEFVDAFHEYRERERDKEEPPRERPRARRPPRGTDEFYDPDNLRRRRPPRDADDD
jgi:hypothetical protein